MIDDMAKQRIGRYIPPYIKNNIKNTIMTTKHVSVICNKKTTTSGLVFLLYA